MANGDLQGLAMSVVDRLFSMPIGMSVVNIEASLHDSEGQQLRWISERHGCHGADPYSWDCAVCFHLVTSRAWMDWPGKMKCA